jgi:putative FmdB family regulatory protein
MPIFDYQCKKCGKTDEYIVKSAESRGLKCKHCGSAQLKRLLGAATVVANPNNREPPNYGSYKRNPIYD